MSDIKSSIANKENELFTQCSKYLEQADYTQLINSCVNFLKINPNSAVVYFYLGSVYWQKLNRGLEALSCFFKALDADPTLQNVKFIIGYILFKQNKFRSCQYFLEQELNSNNAFDAAFILGSAYRECGDIESSIKSFLCAQNIKPMDTRPLAYLILACSTHNYSQALYKESVRKLHEITYANIVNETFSNNGFKSHDFSKNKKIKLAFVSKTFCKKNSWSMIEYWLDQVIERLDKNKFEVYCYQISNLEDEHTLNFQKISNYKKLINKSQSEIATEIYNDGVDILMEMSSFTPDKNFELFALKPAPVQISWISHISSGLKEIDYIFANPDLYSDEEISHMSEKLYTFESVFFRPRVDLPDIKPAPLTRNGYITFGSLNRGEKITTRMLLLWAKIMSKLPESKIVLQLALAQDSLFCDEVLKLFSNNGISRERVILEDRKETADYYQSYNNIDIILDTFPYNGGYTSADALCMGTPIVSLVGENVFSRMTYGAVNRLRNIELRDAMLAYNEDEYIDKAIKLANNTQLITQAQETRDDILNSAFADCDKYVVGFEEALSAVWQNKVEESN